MTGTPADATLRRALRLLADLVDRKDCRPGFAGGCGTHYTALDELAGVCPHREAKELLDTEGVKW